MKSKYFDTKKELACPCCGIDNVSAGFLLKMDEAREIAGIPFVVNSGARCINHNRMVGGKDESSHIASEDKMAKAMDIRVMNSGERYVILSALIKAGFNRIGIADSFIHVDLDLDKPKNVVWTY